MKKGLHALGLGTDLIPLPPYPKKQNGKKQEKHVV